MKEKRYFYLILACACLALFFLQGLNQINSLSSTWDEPFHIYAGYAYWTTGRFDINCEHPPLLKLIATIPLLSLHPQIDIPDLSIWESTKRAFAFETYLHNATQFLFENKYGVDVILNRCRIVILIVGLFLGFLVFRWSYEEYGVKAALVSLALYSFSPNILAHASVVGTDLGAACGIFASWYYYRKLLEKQDLQTSVVFGIILGSTLIVKFSTLMVLPLVLIFGGLFVVQRVKNNRERRTQWEIVGLLLKCLIVSFVVASVVVWACYGFQIAAGTLPVARHPGFVALLQHFRLGKIEGDLYSIVLPAKALFEGLFGQFSNYTRGGFGSYLNGRFTSQSQWYYYPEAFFIKSTIPFLLVIFIAFVMDTRIKRSEIYILAPVALLFIFAINGKVAIGLRYILPICPFLYVFCGRIFSFPRSPWLHTLLVAFLISWNAFEAISINPNNLSYFNQIAGGPSNGHKYLADSNLDWGQGLKQLKAYMDKEKIQHINLAYVGTAKPEKYGIRFTDLPPYERRSGIIAIGATALLQGTPNAPDGWHWLKKFEPIEKVGYSIYVYNVPEVQRPYVNAGHKP